jgi:hypothetical protein
VGRLVVCSKVVDGHGIEDLEVSSLCLVSLPTSMSQRELVSKEVSGQSNGMSRKIVMTGTFTMAVGVQHALATVIRETAAAAGIRSAVRSFAGVRARLCYSLRIRVRMY